MVRRRENRAGRLPRTRGDEPRGFAVQTGQAAVCPAPAGMSPERGAERCRGIGLPRTRGDEPLDFEHVDVTAQGLPRTRGDEPAAGSTRNA